MSQPSPLLERRVVSVLFADLVGFTALSEGLDAEDVAAVQEQYFARVRETIDRYGGRLEKFIGDAAMAVFGVPRARDDDAERAVRAGLALVRGVEALGAAVGLAEDALQLRVGVNTGEVAYAPGDGGEWRVSGDAVNTAARLQAAAEPGSVLIGDTAALTVAEAIVVDRPVELALKGKEQPVRAWRAVSVLPSRSRERAMGALRAPLLGREPELARLGDVVERARGGATEALLMVAAPGTGKTRLVDEVAGRAETLGLRVRRARLRPQTTSPADVATQLLEPLDAAVAELATALPAERAADVMAEVRRLSRDSNAPADGAQISGLAEGRVARFGAWIEALDALAGRHAQLIVLDDLHWASGDILAFVELLAKRPAPVGRFVLGTTRPALLDELARRGDGAPSLATHELAPLGAPDAGALVRALVGAALPDVLVDAIVGRSDGNPLFIEELLRSWVSVGTLVREGDDRWELTAPPDEVPLPQTVQQIYAAQLDDLPGSARMLVRRASVAGRQVPRRSLDALDVENAVEALEIARRRTLLADGATDDVSGPSLVYRHALLRDAGYGSLSRAERARLHARLAAWYEAAARDRLDDVAEHVAGHYAAAIDNASRLSPRIDGDLDVRGARRLAIEWYERAARRALVDAAHESARAHLRSALAHAADAPPLVRSRLLLALGEATAYTADMDDGARLLSEALDLARAAYSETGEDRTAVRVAFAAAAAALGRVWVQQVRFDEAGRLVDEALAAIDGPDDGGVARLLAIRGWVLSQSLDPASLGDLDRALAIARDVADRRLELEVLDWRAGVLGELGSVKANDWEAVESLALELGDWSRAVKAMRVLAAWDIDDAPHRVWPAADRAEEICRRRGMEEDLCWLDYARSEAGLVSGDWDRALEAGLRVLDVGERNAYDRAVVRTLHVLLPIASARGRRDLVERALRWHAARRAHFPDSPYARIMGAAIDLQCARAGLLPTLVPEVAPRLVVFDSAPMGPSYVAALEEVFDSWLAAGQIDGAREAVDRLDRAIADEPETSHLGRGSARLMRARLSAAAGEPPADVAAATRRALAEFRQSGAPWWIARALANLVEQGAAASDEAAELDELHHRLGVASR